MARGIKLNRYQIAQANHWHLKVWRLRVEVAEVSGGMEPNVFLWRQNDPDPHTDDVTYEFVTVATVGDMSEYPEGGPNPFAENPYFRTPFFEIDLSSQSDYDDVWHTIQVTVMELVQALDRAEKLELSESVWLGTSPEVEEQE